MLKKLSAALILTTLLLSLTACQGQPDTSEKQTSSSRPLSLKTEDDSSGSSSAASSWTDEDDQSLYNMYIDVYNYSVGRLGDSIDEYFENVAMEEEFQLLDDYYCYSIPDYQIENLDKTYSLSESKPEKDPLDDSFIAMYPSLKTLMTTLNNIYNYADLQSYVDDDYAKAKEYHATLWAAMNEYANAAAVFMTELDTVVQEQQEQDLQMMKEEGFVVFYTINVMFLQAQAIDAEFYNQEISDENLTELDLTTIEPMYDEFVTSVEAILSYAEDSDQLQAEGIPYNSGYWTTFLSSLKDTKVSLTGILQRVKEQNPVSSFDLNSSFALPGDDTIASFERGLSDMISDYNQFIQY